MRVVTRYREEWFPGVDGAQDLLRPGRQRISRARACGRTASRSCARTIRRGTAFAFSRQQQRARRAPRDDRGAGARRCGSGRRPARGSASTTRAGCWCRRGAACRRGSSSPTRCESGYVWDAHMISASPTSRCGSPLKDGWYEHAQNCAEYLQLNFSPRRKRADADRAARAAGRARSGRRLDGMRRCAAHCVRRIVLDHAGSTPVDRVSHVHVDGTVAQMSAALVVAWRLRGA